ncbi:MAG: hypothetical protein PT120_19060 [Aphanizomenon gracile PMC649.10]|jgi:hypothetical protein|nr:hypothetical protein [Aphanizomenon gracile PMC627.10]MDM3856923.1 hypothetical protein [Aphanizomenon gracile PMC649.10]
MARYTCAFILSVNIDNLQALLIDVLNDLELDVQYYTSDYIMAREIPGNASFSELVTVEVMIDTFTATETEIRMTLLAKNEELPLILENHCRKIFEYVKQAIKGSRHWHLIEEICG